jgi:hypothetical protein
MNAAFLKEVRTNDGSGRDIRTASGTFPDHVHPPVDPKVPASLRNRPAYRGCGMAA